jgi:RNA polymerase sigma-70 factor (ECF subfamily)
MQLAPPPVARTVSEAALRDADVLALLACGDLHGAFDLLVPRYEAKVYRLCFTLLREPAAAQDAAQDSLLRVWQALPRFEPAKAALSTWVYAVARNRCLTLLATRPGHTESMSLPEVEAEVDLLAAPAAAWPGDDPASTVRHLVGALPEAPRRCLTLFYYEERSVAEVAAMLGVPEGTVKTHLHRGRAALLKALQALGLADPQLWLA